MFVWFGLQKSNISLLLHPPSVQTFERELAGYTTTKAAVHLPLDDEVPVGQVMRLVKASLGMMEAKLKKGTSRPRT
jgi:uncharacterized protein YdhG (YjbR/CyaY superfamily)